MARTKVQAATQGSEIDTDLDNVVMESFPFIWEHALASLEGYEVDGLGFKYSGKCDPRPLGKLMEAGATPPPEILRLIGSMFDPPQDWRGPRFKIVTPLKRDRRAHIKELSIKRRIRNRFEELRSRSAQGSFDSDVKQVMFEFSGGRSFVFQAVKLSDLDIVRAVNDPRQIKEPKGHKLDD